MERKALEGVRSEETERTQMDGRDTITAAPQTAVPESEATVKHRGCQSLGACYTEVDSCDMIPLCL